jgi:hypothetical protein
MTPCGPRGRVHTSAVDVHTKSGLSYYDVVDQPYVPNFAGQ